MESELRMYFEHRCENCLPIGKYVEPVTSTRFDLYVCAEAVPPTFVARFGNEPDDYLYGTQIAPGSPCHAECIRRVAIYIKHGNAFVYELGRRVDSRRLPEPGSVKP